MAHGADPSPDALRRAKAAAQTAVELDPALPQAVCALGIIKGYDEWDWAGGERDLRRAIDLNPSFAMAHYHLAWFLAVEDRLPEAIAEHIKARDVDPLNPLHTAWLGELYRLNGEPEKAIAEARKALELNPAFTTSQFVMALAYADQAKWDLAVEAARRAADGDPDWRWAVGAMCAAAGRTAEARQVLAKLNALPVDPWGAVWRALIHAALGEKDAAFEWVNHEPHHPWVAAIFLREWEFWTKALVDDPRFEQCRRKMGVPLRQEKDQRGGPR
jgi:tetratricopeptide (TPR) repeat protein